MYRCCPCLRVLPVMLRVVSWELVASVIESLVVAVILPSVVQTFSIVYSNLLRKHGWRWSTSDRCGRPSVLGEIIWVLCSPVEVLHWLVFPRGIYCKEDDYGRCRLFTCVACSSSVVQLDGWKICGMIYEFSGSAKLSGNVPEFDGWFMYYVLNTAWSFFPIAWFSICR